MGSNYLLDASAVLAMIKNEPAAGEVLDLIEGGALIHSVNLVEVMTKVQQAGGDVQDVRALSLNVITDLPVETAERCASLHKATRAQGLSLGDCICLGVAALHGWTAVTRDLAWAEVGKRHGIEVQLVRAPVIS